MNYLLGIDNQSISSFNDINNIFEGKLKEFNNANNKPNPIVIIEPIKTLWVDKSPVTSGRSKR